MGDYSKDGRESEWNEAALKSKRLDDIQKLINMLRLDPLIRTGNKFNYQYLLLTIGLLYGEGRSKYSDNEKIEVDNIKQVCIDTLKYHPPHTLKINSSLNKNIKISYLINQEYFEKFMDLLDFYENKVKDYNDAHGLTTKNKRKGGMF